MKNHRIGVETFERLNEILVTTLPCLTEVVYFLGESKGWRGQEKLWNLVENQSLEVY